MYALARNTWKFQNRDKRISKIQHIEFEALAPDTIEEIFNALHLLELWTSKAAISKSDKPLIGIGEDKLASIGRKYLMTDEKLVNSLEVLGENMENTNRRTLIIKPFRAYHAYRDMIHYYAVNNLLTYIDNNPKASFENLQEALKGKRKHVWVNLGGQIMLQEDLDKLRKDIGSGKLNTWTNIHKRYDNLWEKYTTDKQKHAYASLLELMEIHSLTPDLWKKALNKAIGIQQYVCDQVYISRKKDYDNPYRQATFRNDEEMRAAIGTIDDNSFIVQVRKETVDYKKTVADVIKKTTK
jgi:hypothetical protein